MFDQLKRVLFLAHETTAPESDADFLKIATSAVLMEVAQADEEFVEEERQHILSTLREQFALAEPKAEHILQQSIAQRAVSSDIWHFTHEINRACTVEEKQAIIEAVWRVIYADGTLDAQEDYLVHKLAKLLNLNHPQLIEAKLKVRKERPR